MSLFWRVVFTLLWGTVHHAYLFGQNSCSYVCEDGGTSRGHVTHLGGGGEGKVSAATGCGNHSIQSINLLTTQLLNRSTPVKTLFNRRSALDVTLLCISQVCYFILRDESWDLDVETENISLQRIVYVMNKIWIWPIMIVIKYTIKVQCFWYFISSTFLWV